MASNNRSQAPKADKAAPVVKKAPVAKVDKAAAPASQTGLVNTKPAKGAVTLDRSKKFYDVFGGNGAKFEQDGKLFNAEGQQVDTEGNLVKVKVVEVSPTTDVGNADPDALTSGSMDAAGNVTGDADGGNPDAEKTGVNSEDDLAALGGK